ncbi:TetR family transcriptional regulator [Nocardia sp. NPDC020380]|uniref:acyl-CoA-like ligand-binding transcription factor n=1 Tax=Nocardia sp. NPDC020380 TaxID=3364309 RepID=UPI0037AFD59F
MSADAAKPGLRERKKARTRAAIQAHALELFLKQGYEATKIEQIIEAAEISESTFFRYFPTKEDLVLQDEYDPQLVEGLRAQPADVPPITAMRRVVAEVFGGMSERERAEQRERIDLVLSVPALRATMLDQLMQGTRLLAVPLAERTGRNPGDFAVRVIAGAIIGALTTVLIELADNPDADLVGLMDEAMAHLESGLEL